MLEEFEKLIKELKKFKKGKPTLLELVKDCEYSKEEWEDYKKEKFEDIKEVDKYFEELEKKEQKPKLTDKEREYLSAVIKPFRDKINFIIKRSFPFVYVEEYICIDLTKERVCLPLFEEGKYYQGLELDREYDLEELGL